MGGNIIDNLFALLHSLDIRTIDRFAAQDTVNTEVDSARFCIVEYDIKCAELALREYLIPFRHLAAKDSLDVLDGYTGVGIFIVDNESQTIVGNGNAACDELAVGEVLHLAVSQSS